MEIKALCAKIPDSTYSGLVFAKKRLVSRIHYITRAHLQRLLDLHRKSARLRLTLRPIVTSSYRLLKANLLREGCRKILYRWPKEPIDNSSYTVL